MCQLSTRKWGVAFLKMYVLARSIMVFLGSKKFPTIFFFKLESGLAFFTAGVIIFG